MNEVRNEERTEEKGQEKNTKRLENGISLLTTIR